MKDKNHGEGPSAEKPRVIRLTMEYDGTHFSGWQIQPARRTVQGEIESALEKLTGDFIRITGSGRTDAGVHARAQTASFTEKKELPLQAYRDGLNGFLPDDIMIKEALEEVPGFNARRAFQRVYRYYFLKNPDVLQRLYAWYPGPLNIPLMEQTGRVLMGKHDFTSFCKPDGKSSHLSEILDMSWEQSGETFFFEIRGKRFFHHMVRVILGTLIEIGRGRWNRNAVGEILKGRNRTLAGPTIPPQGLILWRVDYE